MKRKGRDFGALLVDKPRGPSSHEVVQWVRWALGTSSVGHCGTLDPDASGLLVLVVGKATRLAARLSEQNKSYDAVFALGARTDTDDSQGEVLERAPVSASQVQAALDLFDGAWCGVHRLAPPRYSAVRVNGVRAHKAARQGEALELALREMDVRGVSPMGDTELASFGLDQREDLCSDCRWVGAHLDVSKGSYIRSLALDLGRRIAAPVHLAALRRTRCGDHALKDPRVVRSLAAIPWTPAPNGAPRWRIRWGEGDKAEQARKVRGALIDPFPLLGLSLLQAQAHPEIAREWAPRVFHGQGMPVSALSAHLQDDAQHCVWLDQAGGQAAILRREHKRGLEQWAPELVLRWPVLCDSSKKLEVKATNA